jgi:hypothetical protein
MSLQTLKRAFDHATILPPEFDLVAAMAAVKSFQDFERAVERLETEAAAWRSQTIVDQINLRKVIDTSAAGFPLEVVWPELEPLVERVIDAAERGIEAHSTPIDKDPRFALPLARVRRLTPNVARYFKRMLKRADAVRQSQLSAYEHYRDAMLTIVWDYDPEARGGPSFDNAKDLIDYLHS